jgi:hypothetical protein
MKDLINTHGQSLLWALAFLCVSVLVGLGKLDPKTLEYMLFGLAGTTVPTIKRLTDAFSPKGGSDAPSGN